MGLKWRTLIKKFTVAALHEFIPSLASYFELSCWILPPLEAALSLIASKVVHFDCIDDDNKDGSDGSGDDSNNDTGRTCAASMYHRQHDFILSEHATDAEDHDVQECRKLI